MTAVAALITAAGDVYLACDSLTEWSGVPRHVDKIITRGAWSFTLAGLGATAAWLQYGAPLQDDGEDDGAYMYRLSLQLDAWARSVGSNANYSDGTNGPQVAVLAACSRGAWTVAAGGGVLQVRDLATGGDGTAVAAGFHAARSCGADELQALRAAMAAASAVCPSVGGPLQVVHITPAGPVPA